MNESGPEQSSQEEEPSQSQPQPQEVGAGDDDQTKDADSAAAEPAEVKNEESVVAGGDKHDKKEEAAAAAPVVAADAAMPITSKAAAVSKDVTGSKMATAAAAAAVPKGATAAAAPSAQPAAKAPVTSPAAAAAPANITQSPDLPTLERAYKIFGLSGAAATKKGIENKLEEARKDVATKFEELISGIADQPELLQSIVLLTDRLKGPLPFIDKLKRDDSSEMQKQVKENEVIQSVLPTWDEYSKKPEISKLETAKKEALKEKFNAWRLAEEQRLIYLYAIGATQGDPDKADAALDHSEKNDPGFSKPKKSNCINKAQMSLQLEAIRKNAMNSLRPGATNDQAMDAFAKQLKEEGFISVGGPLFYKVDQDSGEKLFVVLGLNSGNLGVVDTIIEEKAYKGEIEWSNVPKDVRPEVENRCLARWLDVYMDSKDKKTFLSECKPQTPGNWHEWLQNIDKKSLWRRDSFKRRLVQGVVGGEDPKDSRRLREFWSDVSRNASPEELVTITRFLTPKQKETLRDQYIDGLKEANKDIDQAKKAVAEAKTKVGDLTGIAGKEADLAEAQKQLTFREKVYAGLVINNTAREPITLKEFAKLVVSSPKLMSQKEQGELVQSNPEFLFYLSKEMAPEKFADFCQKLPPESFKVLEDKERREGLQKLFVDEVNRASQAKERLEKTEEVAGSDMVEAVVKAKEGTPTGMSSDKAVAAVAEQQLEKETTVSKQAANDLSNAENNLKIFIGVYGSPKGIKHRVEAVMKDIRSQEKIKKQAMAASAQYYEQDELRKYNEAEEGYRKAPVVIRH